MWGRIQGLHPPIIIIDFIIILKNLRFVPAVSHSFIEKRIHQDVISATWCYYTKFCMKYDQTNSQQKNFAFTRVYCRRMRLKWSKCNVVIFFGYFLTWLQSKFTYSNGVTHLRKPLMYYYSEHHCSSTLNHVLDNSNIRIIQSIRLIWFPVTNFYFRDLN